MRSLSIIVTIIIKAFATFVKLDEECFSGEMEKFASANRTDCVFMGMGRGARPDGRRRSGAFCARVRILSVERKSKRCYHNITRLQCRGYEHEKDLVQRTFRISDMAAQLRGRQRRRRGRPYGRAREAGLHQEPRRGRDMVFAALRISAKRLRLRHSGLLQHQSRIRHDGGFQGGAGRRAFARHEGHHGPCGQPHFRSARVVQKERGKRSEV